MNGGLLELIRTFVRAVETGSFTAVANETGSTQATVSRHISSLESHLDARLFNRTTRSMTLTEEGQNYYEHALTILDSVEQAEAAVKPKRHRVTGTLRVTGPLAFTRLQIIPRIGRFLARYPEIKTDFVLSDRPIDLVEAGVDVGIRIGEIKDESLIARPVGETRRVTVARPDYFANRLKPEHPADLASHNCIVYSSLATTDNWFFRNPETGQYESVKVSGTVRVNVSEAMRQAILEGLGIAVAPVWLFDDELETGRLVSMLDQFEPTPLPINAIYPSRRMITPRVRAFIDFIAEEFQNDPRVARRSTGSASFD